MKRAALRLILPLALFAGVLFASVPSEAVKGCKKDKDRICPLIFAPVVCDNGRTYSNSCFAGADCAQNCVPAS